MGERQAEAVRAELHLHGQDHVLRHWDELPDSSAKRLIAQLSSFDLDLLDRLIASGDGAASAAVTLDELDEPEVMRLPETDEEVAERRAWTEAGLAAIKGGRIAVLIVAGGQGSRLGYEGPKGCFPIGPVTDRSLFQLHFEKILAASRRAGRPIPLYLMTSETNDRPTREFLREHDHFGLDPEDVFILTQGMMPAVTPEGKLLLEAPDRVFAAPNGHGGTLKALADSGALDDMTARGIEHIYYFQVDNPMQPVPDPAFMGCHIQTGSDMSSKVLSKRDAGEPIGTAVRRGGRVEVIEYSDIPPEVRDAKDAEGEMRWPFGSIAVHGISVAFVKRFAKGEFVLPYHRALKKIPYIDERKRCVKPDEPNGIKFEMFIFDALPFARKAMLFEVDRQREFAPVKNATGQDSVATCRRALINQYAEWLEAAGVLVPRDEDGSVLGAVEVSPLTADSAEAMIDSLPRGTEFRDGLAL